MQEELAADPNGVTYYANTAEIDGLKEGINPKEIIWRQNLVTNNRDQNLCISAFFVWAGSYESYAKIVDAFRWLMVPMLPDSTKVDMILQILFEGSSSFKISFIWQYGRSF